MTSYQRLKRKLAYEEQRGRELEDILREVDSALARIGVTVKTKDKGLRGDEFLTDINTGNADFGLINIQLRAGGFGD